MLFSSVIDCGMIRVLFSSVIDYGLDPQSGQTRLLHTVYKIGISCFSAEQAALMNQIA